HGKSGDLARKDRGTLGLVASDLRLYLPMALIETEEGGEEDPGDWSSDSIGLRIEWPGIPQRSSSRPLKFRPPHPGEDFGVHAAIGRKPRTLGYGKAARKRSEHSARLGKNDRHGRDVPNGNDR